MADDLEMTDENLSLIKNHMERSLRRHHRMRLKDKRKHYYGYPHRQRGTECLKAMSDRELGKVARTAQLCSCSGCGNPRRSLWNKKERLTIQELRFKQREKIVE